MLQTRIAILILLITTTTISFAGSPEFTVSKFKQGDVVSNGNVVYALPETLLNLKITYTVISELQRYAGYEYGSVPRSIEISKPVEVTVSSAPDLENRYQLHTTSATKNPFFTTLAGISLTDDGVLKGANAQFDDRTLPAIGKFVTTVARVALFAAAGEESLASGKELEKALRARLSIPDGDEGDKLITEFKELVISVDRGLDALIAEASKANPSPERLEKLSESLKVQNASIEMFVLRYRKYRSDDYAVNVLITTDDFLSMLDAGKYAQGEPVYVEVVPREQDVPAGLRKAVTGTTPLPKMTIQLGIMPDDIENARNYFDGKTQESVPGIIHRYSTPVSMEMAIPGPGTTYVVDRRMIHFPQFSPFVQTAIEKKRLSSRTTKLGVSPTTGNLTSYEVSQQSVAESVASALDSTTKDLQGVYAANLGQRISEQTLDNLTAGTNPLDSVSAGLGRYNTLIANWKTFVSGLQSLNSLPVPAG